MFDKNDTSNGLFTSFCSTILININCLTICKKINKQDTVGVLHFYYKLNRLLFYIIHYTKGYVVQT